MRKRALVLSFLVFIACLGCRKAQVVGTYEADVPFRGGDPRFAGESYRWHLELGEDGSFSFATEQPLAAYLNEPPHEIVSKGKMITQGSWTAQENVVQLLRQTGPNNLGCAGTLSFSFVDNRLRIVLDDDTAILEEGSERLELKKVSK